MQYQYIKVEEVNACVGLITLNRPKALNALSTLLIKEVSLAVQNFEEKENIGAIVLTGGDKVFAAGADIKEISSLDFASAYTSEFVTKDWKALEEHKKPIVAAVAGFALGGGCELSLLCDITICDENAKFGQPEVKIGVMPGIGGTQRLTRIVGKSKAMMMCLTGEMIDAQESKELGIVGKISESGKLIEDAIDIATKISSMSQPVIKLIKESIDNVYEVSLSAGLASERKSFYSTFSLEDKQEGINAFLEKRKPKFKHK
jgi:enoyl-CoA hydratase/carnithine racemase